MGNHTHDERYIRKSEAVSKDDLFYLAYAGGLAYAFYRLFIKEPY